MLVRFFESLLTNLINGAQDRREAREQARQGVSEALPPPPAAALDEDVLLGYTLAPPTRPGQDGAARADWTPEPVRLSPRARLRHIYGLGATGSGKTNLLLQLIEHDVARGRTVCVLDLRGDLVDRVLVRLAASSDAAAGTLCERLLLIDLREKERIVGINPLLGPGDAYSRALHLLAVIRGQHDDKLGVTVDECLRNALVALTEAGGTTLLDLEPLLTVAPFRAGILKRVSDSHTLAYFRRYDALSPDKQASLYGAVLNKITPLLAHPHLRRVFGQARQAFDLGALFDRAPGNGAVVLVALAADRLHGAANLVGGLLVSMIENQVMARADRPEHKRFPVHLYLDEFQNLVTVSDRFESIVGEGRRFGLGLILSHQNLAQLPVSLRATIRNNVATQLLFATGAGDAADLSADVVSDAYGAPGEVKRVLVTQGVGEAFLVRRGHEAVRIRVPHAPDPPRDTALEARAAALREGSLQAYGRAAAEVERELNERERYLLGLEAGTPAPYPARPNTGPRGGRVAAPPMTAQTLAAPAGPNAAAKPGLPPAAPAPAHEPEQGAEPDQQAEAQPSGTSQAPTATHPVYQILPAGKLRSFKRTRPATPPASKPQQGIEGDADTRACQEAGEKEDTA